MLFVRLDVDVAGPLAHRVGDQGVDQLDHRGLVRGRHVGGQRFGLVVLVLDDFQLGVQVLHDRGQRFGVVVQPIDGLLDFGLGADVHVDFQPGDELDVVDGEDVRRVGHGHRQAAPVAPDRHHLETGGHLGRHQPGGGRVDLDVREIGQRHAVEAGEELPVLLLVQGPQPHQRQRQAPAASLGELLRLRHLLRRDLPDLDEFPGQGVLQVSTSPSTWRADGRTDAPRTPAMTRSRDVTEPPRPVVRCRVMNRQEFFAC